MKLPKIYFVFLALAGVLLISASGLSYGTKMAETANFVMVSHSEYKSGEIGQIIGKLYNYRGQPVLADCAVTIYNPDKSVYLASTPTDDTLESTDGTHYINFTTPSVEGVYEYMISCNYQLNNKNQTRTISNSFHLSPALNLISTINASTSGLQNIYPAVVQINSTVNEIYSNMFSDLDAYNNFTAINNNFATVNTKLDNIQNNITQLKQYCSDAETNSSALCQVLWDNNQKIIAMQNDVNYISDVQLQVINQTTNNIYDYLTVNVATSLNSILLDTGIIKSGITDINSTVNKIESNVTTVISNQEDVVYFDVTS